MAFLAALRPFAFGGRIDRAALLLLAMPSLAASLLVVSIRIDLLVLEGLPGGPHSLRAVALCAISVLITAGWLATRGIRGAAGIASTLGLWVLVLLALGTRDRILSYGAYQGIGALVLARNTRGESP